MPDSIQPDIESLTDYQREFGGLKGFLIQYIDDRLSADMLIGIAKLFSPDFVLYEDCVMRSEDPEDRAFDRKQFDFWVDHFQGDLSAVERLANHIHLSDFLTATRGLNDQNFYYFACVLARSWKCALETQFPERRFKTSVTKEGDGDITIAFWQDREGSS